MSKSINPSTPVQLSFLDTDGNVIELTSGVDDLDLFNHLLAYQQTSEFQQETDQYHKRKNERSRPRHIKSSRRYRLKFPDAWKDRRDARRWKQLLYDRQHGLCHWCYQSLDNEYDIDHIKPYVKGGRATLSNLCVAHIHCNRSKKALSGFCLKQWAERIRR